MHMDALAVWMAKACCQFLDGQQLLPRKPELVVGRRAIRYCATQHLIYAIAAEIAIALDVLSSQAAIHIEIGTADHSVDVPMERRVSKNSRQSSRVASG